MTTNDDQQGDSLIKIEKLFQHVSLILKIRFLPIILKRLNYDSWMYHPIPTITYEHHFIRNKLQAIKCIAIALTKLLFFEHFKKSNAKEKPNIIEDIAKQT